MASLQCYKTCEVNCQEKNHHGSYGQKGNLGYSNGGYSNGGYSSGGYNGYSNGGYTGQQSGHSNGGYNGLSNGSYNNGQFNGQNGYSNGGYNGGHSGLSNGGYNGGYTGQNSNSNGGYNGYSKTERFSKSEVLSQSAGHLASSKTYSSHAAGGTTNLQGRRHKKSLFGKIKNGLSGHSSDEGNSSCSDSGSDSDNEKSSRRKNYCN